MLWSGQMASAIGTAMTQFALTIWIWQLTQETTAIALLSFFFQLPQILVGVFAGLVIDRCNRKFLIMFSDASVAICTIAIGLLYITDQLQLWHLYGLAIAYGGFGQIQGLAYIASIPLMVSKQQYTRVSSMRSLVEYSSAILAPALVGSLYSTIGLIGIMLIDLATFAIGVTTVWLIQIPQPRPAETEQLTGKTIWKQLSWGLHYILSRPSLLAITVIFCLFLFARQMSDTLYQPLVLARTNGDAQLLSRVVIAAGVGGVVGGVSLSILGGFQRRIYGMLLGFMGAGIGGILLGLGRVPWLWMGAQFFSAFNIPLTFSSSYAIWYAKVAPEVQGRVLAAAHTLGLTVGAMASLIAGPLADRVFEPMISSGGWLSRMVVPLVGTGTGAGIALLVILAAIWMILLGVSGYLIPAIRQVEDLLPDHDRE
ncbi:MFS transporter [Pantanalinema rosaneae CENA516]|uniref:MFS transporter n=1 Tax=Pantanalinema rosaneae TaxID=1620701 RepID=UPI003D6FC3A2